jgi:hypothetical protein
MAIDDPFAAIENQYGESENSELLGRVVHGATTTLSVAALGGDPHILLFTALSALLERILPTNRNARAQALLDMLIAEFRKHDVAIQRMGVQISDLQRATQIALTADANMFNDQKRDRYVKMITNAIYSETQIDELASFIQDVERLNERDIVGLKVLNEIMNRAGDWGAPKTPHDLILHPYVIHPGTFIGRAQELSTRMASVLGKDTNKNTYSREDGLQICLRLQGFGLAEKIDTESRQVPITNYAARLTPRGMILLKLLGETVPNWDHYFDANGPL